MKNINKKTLSLEKIKIAKLSNSEVIVGGNLPMQPTYYYGDANSTKTAAISLNTCVICKE